MFSELDHLDVLLRLGGPTGIALYTNHGLSKAFYFNLLKKEVNVVVVLNVVVASFSRLLVQNLFRSCSILTCCS